MTAIVVNHLREMYQNIGTAVLYCSYNMDQLQTRVKLLGGLVRQLVSQKHTELEALQELYEACKKSGRPPTFAELSCCFEQIIGLYSQVFILIDAVDECGNAEAHALISEIQLLQARRPSAQLMLTFRPHVRIGGCFTRAREIEIRAGDGDLGHYLNCNMLRLSKRVHDTPALKEVAVSRIIRAAHGM
jgi:hypothetical protein